MLSLLNFCLDEDGFILSSESLLLATIVVLGLLVGIDSIQDAVVQELDDFADSFGFLNQSYSYSGVSDDTSSTEGGVMDDTQDEDQPMVMLGEDSEQ